jgi:5-formaminoimidazole-4-carboxamide-1-(beta)-D-ribofuranosyl 5'-monophosphate synthetase
MITSSDISKILSKYDFSKLAIGTLGSHSSLNIFKGAKEEGFRTVAICKEKDAIMYKKFPLADEMIFVKDFTELLSETLQEKLRKLNVILIPHGSFTAYLSTACTCRCLETGSFSTGKPTAKSRKNGCAKQG